MIRASPRHVVCFLIALASWRFVVETNDDYGTVSLVAEALSTTTNSNSNSAATTCASASSTQPLLSPESVANIASGGVAVLRGFVPPDLVERLRADARSLQQKGHFRPDGLTNNALQTQGFTKGSDRQTFRNPQTGEQSWFRDDLGDYSTRLEFDRLLGRLRTQLAADLGRPTLLDSDDDENGDSGSDSAGRHEITYNWYEPGAKLGRHLDEHHEETKGPRGWRYPSRRSVTWLVYLNDHWTSEEGGALLCHPRSSTSNDNDIKTNEPANNPHGPIGSHEGNLQVGWMDGYTPVYLDAFRESGQTALYSTRMEMGTVTPEGGTLVLFDSVTLPHSVLEVTGKRQRIAATGWFHEDSQFAFEV
eukprot:jgi/Psemu1/210934/e_gw1.548.12.1